MSENKNSLEQVEETLNKVEEMVENKPTMKTVLLENEDSPWRNAPRTVQELFHPEDEKIKFNELNHPFQPRPSPPNFCTEVFKY